MLFVGRATTKGIAANRDLESADSPEKVVLSKTLLVWSLLAFLSLGWIVFYVNTIRDFQLFPSQSPLMIYAEAVPRWLFVVLYSPICERATT